jgi:succinyl-CoA synthetase beta subunit
MKVHEYQAKEILKRHKANVPFGVVLSDKKDANAAYEQVSAKSPIVVVKAQIHAGGRGKGGGVKVTKTKEDAMIAIDKILGMQLVTPQTGPGGKKVLKVYLEQGIQIQKEFYISILLDRTVRKTLIMASTEGGMEIEEVAAKTPEKIVRLHVDPGAGIQANEIRFLFYQLGLPKESQKSFSDMVTSIYNAYIQEDLSLLEINPLILTSQNEIVAGDCKMDLDENALFRHTENAEFRDTSEEDPLELQASEYHLNYVKLDGNIGCMVNGAGLAMATMDIVKLAGAEPANFLDVGGGANVTTVTNGFKIILGDPHVKGIFVNIFGGIVRCDRVANGIIEAAKAVHLNVPLVVRLKGTNAEEGKKILNDSGLKITGVEDLREAASTIASLIQ